ncbi:MAG: tRNA pseudouridine(13) synthase TruD [Desulfuromonadales bacterium C00003068]|jgi:tRNA pseudouridine13 synthase|nr:MAG: tRNA pseudouridine(13) synthase TruD [Desulfuromonadales bacterium C00003068]
MRPYLTRAFAGTAGTIKDAPEDFIVEEIAAYEPCGTGEHLFLRVEKQGMSTFAMMQRIASALGIKEKELGYAGLKDAKAITRQWISLPQVEQAKIHALDLDDITILSSSQHTNKLRLGHLRGNRFHIRIHNVVEDAEQRALDILHVLEHTGVPNFFGEQRYGSLACNHLIGRAILQEDFKRAAELIIGDPDKISNDRWHMAATAYAQGDTEGALAALPGRFRDERRLLHTLLRGKDHRQAVLGLPRKLLRLYLSAYQSHLFDSQVAMRLDSIDTIWPGDIAYIHNKGACFRVENPETEQIRADRLEISPSGLLPGHKAMISADQAGVIEHSILDKENLDSDAFTKLTGLKLSGERRPLRVPVEQIECRSHNVTDGTVLELSFALPAGCFATTVLNEIMKNSIQ